MKLTQGARAGSLLAVAMLAAVSAAPVVNPTPATAGEAPTAQLFPSWTNVRVTCTGKNRKIKCRIKGKVEVINDGDVAAGMSKIDIWLSQDDVLDKSDRKLKTLDVPAIAAGDSAVIKLNFGAPKGVKIIRKHLIAVADATNVVVESDEDDNEEAIGPIR